MSKISCKAKTVGGEPCRAPAMEGGLCFLHGNPESAKALGQLGGQKNRRLTVVDLEVPDKMTLSDLMRLNAHTMHLVLSGKLQPRAATAIAQLSNAQLRVMQGADLEARIAMLEKQLAGGNASGDPGEDAAEAEVSLDDTDQNAEAAALIPRVSAR